MYRIEVIRWRVETTNYTLPYLDIVRNTIRVYVFSLALIDIHVGHNYLMNVLKKEMFGFFKQQNK